MDKNTKYFLFKEDSIEKIETFNVEPGYFYKIKEIDENFVILDNEKLNYPTVLKEFGTIFTREQMLNTICPGSIIEIKDPLLIDFSKIKNKKFFLHFKENTKFLVSNVKRVGKKLTDIKLQGIVPFFDVDIVERVIFNVPQIRIVKEPSFINFPKIKFKIGKPLCWGFYSQKDSKELFFFPIPGIGISIRFEED